MLLSAHMQEYDVKVCKNDIMILHLSYKIIVQNIYPQFLLVNVSGNCTYGDVRLVGGSNQYEGQNNNPHY